MNKKILILILVVVVIFSGCSNNISTEIEIEKLEVEVSEEIVSDNSEIKLGENVDKERISGEISKIVANMVTLEIYDAPVRGANKAESDESTSSPLVSTSTVQGSGTGSKGGGGGGMSTTSLEKTGETVELIIPVGTIIKSSANPDMVFDIESLSKGMSIMVFINSELTDNAKLENPDSNIVYAANINIIETN